MRPLHEIETNRSRIAWWVFVVVLGGVVVFVLYSFVGTLTLGLFLYYASRPVYRRVHEVIESDGLAAAATLLLATVPILAVLAYTAATALTDVAASTDVGAEDVADFAANTFLGRELSGSGEELLISLVENPSQIDQVSGTFVTDLLTSGIQTLGVVATALLHVGLAFGIAFSLLRDGDDVAAWFTEWVAGEDSTAYAYFTAVDVDLQSVYFGNVLFVFAVAIIASVVYHAFNFLTPAALSIPAPTLLALLTGITSLVPIVVGKLVYVPIFAFLVVQATGADGIGLTYPLTFLVASFLLLDILPQTFVQPYLAGRTISTELMVFAYLLGPLLFGWYGFFLLPLVLVLTLQAIRIVVVELIHGDRLTARVTDAESMGSDPATAKDHDIPEEAIADEKMADDAEDEDGASGE